MKHVHNALEAASLYATVEGDVRLGNLRFAAPVIVNRYNTSHDDPKAQTQLQSSDGRVVTHIASCRTPSGSSSLRWQRVTCWLFVCAMRAVYLHLCVCVACFNQNDIMCVFPAKILVCPASQLSRFGGPYTCMSPERILGLECSYASDIWCVTASL